MTELGLHSMYAGRPRVQKTCVGESLTQQHFQEECDINTVMTRFAKTGVLTHENPAKPGYGDFSGFDDYHGSMNKILIAQDAFMTVPATIRARFNNDPGEFLEFTTNPDNIDELVEMGLADRPEPLPDHPEVDPAPTPATTPEPTPEPQGGPQE